MNRSMVDLIARKRDGKILEHDDLAFWVEGLSRGEIPDEQSAALLMAIYFRGLQPAELDHLTTLMEASGDEIPLPGIVGPTVDKHSTGGVGDKLSFTACPLAVAAGVKVPMLSGRGLGHTGGTLDKLQAIPGMNVFLEPSTFPGQLNRTGMVVSGQTPRLVPADRKLYALRDVTATVSSLPLIASSIMSKKLALKAQALTLDVKVGSGAFLQDPAQARELCRTMIGLGERAQRRCLALLSDMNQPLGRAVGNALEIRESLEVLKGGGPEDLRTLTLALAALMVLTAGLEPDLERARERVAPLLGNGQALEAFKAFVAAQGGDIRALDDPERLPQAPHRQELHADRSGILVAVDTRELGLAAVELGAGRLRQNDPVEPAAGFLWQLRLGQTVEAGQTMAILHTSLPDRLEGAQERMRRACRILSPEHCPSDWAPPPLIHAWMDHQGEHPWP